MTLAVISNREANYLLQTGLEIFPPSDKYTAFFSQFWIQMWFMHIGSKRFRWKEEMVKYRAGRNNTGCCLANSHIDPLHIAKSCYLHAGLDYISHSNLTHTHTCSHFPLSQCALQSAELQHMLVQPCSSLLSSEIKRVWGEVKALQVLTGLISSTQCVKQQRI